MSERTAGDLADWDYEHMEVKERRPVTSVYSVRFNSSEMAAIRSAARKEGVTTSEFIRRATMVRVLAALPKERLVTWIQANDIALRPSYTLASASFGRFVPRALHAGDRKLPLPS